jgi:hypothetical protein
MQQDHLEKMPQAFVGVHVVDMLPIAREVNVEPCTPDDWELIQLHAGLLETELLRQVRDTRFPERHIACFAECVRVVDRQYVCVLCVDVRRERQASDSDLGASKHSHSNPSIASSWHVSVTFSVILCCGGGEGDDSSIYCIDMFRLLLLYEQGTCSLVTQH